MFTGGTPRRVPQQTLSSAQAAGSLPFATPKAKTVATATGSATAVSTSPISEFLSRHETHAVLVGGASLPETVVADLAKEVAHSPENLTSSVIVHGARGLVVVPRTTELLIWHAKKVPFPLVNCDPKLQLNHDYGNSCLGNYRPPVKLKSFRCLPSLPHILRYLSWHGFPRFLVGTLPHTRTVLASFVLQALVI